MRARTTGRAPNAHARIRAVSLLVATASVPALILGQSVVASAAPTAQAARGAALQPMTASLAAQLSRNVTDHVIVIMKSQPKVAREGTMASTRRAASIAGTQAPMMRELRQVKATHVKAYRLVNAFAATVSKGEATRLKSEAGVKAVIPDVAIHLASPQQASAAGIAGGGIL